MELLLLLGAGIVAGAMNAAVGSGTLVTYPLLLAYGLPPVIANGTNTTGIAPGNVAGAWSYRTRDGRSPAHGVEARSRRSGPGRSSARRS